MFQPAIPTAPGYEAARERVLSLQSDLTEARAEVDQLRGTRQAYNDNGTLVWVGGDLERARDADTAAQATALIEGTKAPARSNEARVTKDVEEAEHRVSVLTVAIIQAETTVTEWLTERTEELVAAAEQFVDAERAAYGAAVEALVTARSQFWATKALASWLRNQDRGYKATVPALLVGGFTQANGESARLEPVIDALRYEVNSSEPERRAVNVRWRKEVVFGDSPNAQRSAVIEEVFHPVEVYADGTEQEV